MLPYNFCGTVVRGPCSKQWSDIIRKHRLAASVILEYRLNIRSDLTTCFDDKDKGFVVVLLLNQDVLAVHIEEELARRVGGEREALLLQLDLGVAKVLSPQGYQEASLESWVQIIGAELVLHIAHIHAHSDQESGGGGLA